MPSHRADDALARGRQAHKRRAWSQAYAELSAAEQAGPLDPNDLMLLAEAAFLTGRDKQALELLTRSHQRSLAGGDLIGAARSALIVASVLGSGGERAQAAGWTARAQRLLDTDGRDCPERGYALIVPAFERFRTGDLHGAASLLEAAIQIGERFDNPDLLATARTGLGRARIMMGEPAAGLALLDEAMVAVTSGEVSPIVSGQVYCIVIEGCQDVLDLRRADEWTAALTRWCDEQPDLVPFTGQCLVHRTQLLRLHGRWHDARDEAERARHRFVRSSASPALGAAVYEQAELHRLHGEYAAAETAYVEASRFGHPGQPGLALLRLGQGDVDAAAAGLRWATEELHEPRLRHQLLAACVDVALAGGDLDWARAAAGQLSSAAEALGAPLLIAMAAHAAGAISLACGDTTSALGQLRRACTAWQDVDAPYDAARTRVLLALACRAVGDKDGERMEVAAARSAFEQLGATPDLARLDALAGGGRQQPPGGLTPREVQVLRLVAAGKTNRAIARELDLSEKTVARHLSNIFTKLALSSRSGATAYAYEQRLV